MQVSFPPLRICKKPDTKRLFKEKFILEKMLNFLGFRLKRRLILAIKFTRSFKINDRDTERAKTAKRRVASLNYFDLLKVAASFDKNENRGEIRTVARFDLPWLALCVPADFLDELRPTDPGKYDRSV